jgi:hypothetical protein
MSSRQLVVLMQQGVMTQQQPLQPLRHWLSTPAACWMDSQLLTSTR